MFFRDEDRSGAGGCGHGFIALSPSGPHCYKIRISRTGQLGKLVIDISVPAAKVPTNPNKSSVINHLPILTADGL